MFDINIEIERIKRQKSEKAFDDVLESILVAAKKTNPNLTFRNVRTWIERRVNPMVYDAMSGMTLDDFTKKYSTPTSRKVQSPIPDDVWRHFRDFSFEVLEDIGTPRPKRGARKLANMLNHFFRLQFWKK